MAPKRRRKNLSGEGGIYQRKDGRVDAYITIHAVDGPKVLRTTKKTKAEARKWLNEKRYERDRGSLTNIDAENITFGQFLDQWLQTIRGSVSRHTFEDYESKVRLHLKPALGRKKLKALTALDLQRLYSAKTASGYSARHVRYVHATARKALGQAERWDYVTKNVARYATPPKPSHKEPRALSLDQVKRFFWYAQGDRFEVLYVLALTTGMRRGELLGLKWSDWEGNQIRIRRSLDGTQEKAPKSESSKRAITLMPEAITALDQQRKRQATDRLRAGPRWQANDYIFPTRLGTAMSGNALRDRYYYPLLERAELPRITFHELRHTFATLQLVSGTPAKVVQEVLGHSSIVQTLNLYSHVVASLQDEAAERLRGRLFGP